MAKKMIIASIEDAKIEMQNAYDETVKLVDEYNKLFVEGGSKSALDKIEEQYKESCNKYTSASREELFIRAKEQPDPMNYAICELYFEGLSVTDEVVNETTGQKRKVAVKRNKIVDLRKLHRFCGMIGHDEKWEHYIQKFNYLLTLKTCIELKIDPKEVNDSYTMSELAKKVKLGGTPTSNTQMLKALNAVISAMVGEEYKAKNHDVKYLEMVYSKKGKKALTVCCASHSHLTAYITEICHRIILEKGYGVEFKKSKK